MMDKSAYDITFVRLSSIDPDLLIEHMSDPRVGVHLPLLKFEFDEQVCQEFVAAKEARWTRDGLGHWAILSDGNYVGWGGFQKEGDEWDFGLVLKSDQFGLGNRIAKQALNFARKDPRIPYVTFLLAPSRRSLRALTRIGAQFVGEVDFERTRFLKYRIEAT